MWSVRNAARMQRDRRRFDSLARTEIAAHVKQNFVRFDVVVHPGNFHRLGMRIQESRCEGADDITANFKGLMNRRRLMDRAGDRLEILRVKCKRIDVTVPTDDIERVVRHRHTRPARTVLNQNFRVLFLVDRVQLSRSVKIALGIGRAHFDLAFTVQITFRDSHRSR